jgi:outer membrane protein assembly factor BamB
MTNLRRVGPTLLLLTTLAGATAQDWPRWRGLGGAGVADGRPLPVTWAPDHHVAWRTPLPGEGSSSPVVSSDDLFLTAALEHGDQRLVLCLDRATGRERWRRALADPRPERTSALTGHAAATPAVDGPRVVAWFGNAGAVCLDRDGRQLWHRKIGEFDTELGLASSPVIDRGRVFLVCDHDGDRFTSFDSFLIALDLATGQTVWQTERRGLGRSWATPILVPGPGGQPLLIVAGQDHLRAYDPETGRERWQTAGLTGWVAPSPVFGQGLIFAVSGKNGPILAARPDGGTAWKLDRGGPYVCSPVLYGEWLYVLDDQGILTTYRAATGAVGYRQRLEGKFTASPVAGDGKVYCTNEAGTTFVIQTGPEYKLLARNALGEETLASAAAHEGRLYLRTVKHLWCVEPGDR